MRTERGLRLRLCLQTNPFRRIIDFGTKKKNSKKGRFPISHLRAHFWDDRPKTAVTRNAGVPPGVPTHSNVEAVRRLRSTIDGVRKSLICSRCLLFLRGNRHITYAQVRAPWNLRSSPSACSETRGQNSERFWDKKEKFKNGTLPNQPLVEALFGRSSQFCRTHRVNVHVSHGNTRFGEPSPPWGRRKDEVPSSLTR